MVGQYIKAVRPLNLAIIGGYQYILYYKYLYYQIENPRLTIWTFFGFVLATLCITGGGYLINDYFDHAGDKINKTNWHTLGVTTLLKYYTSIVGIGLILSLWIAYQIDHLHYATLYIFATAILYLYSAWAKRHSMIGNLIVAIFCGLSIMVMLLTEWPAMVGLELSNPERYARSISIIIGMSVLAFFINLVREMVKDVEDIEGDRIEGYTTLPIKMGIPQTQILILGYLILTLILSIIWVITQWNKHSLIANAVFLMAVIGTLTYTIILGNRLEVKADYSRLSTYLKLTMIFAMIYTIIA